MNLITNVTNIASQIRLYREIRLLEFLQPLEYILETNLLYPEICYTRKFR